MVLAKMSRFSKGHLTINDGEQVLEFGRKGDPLNAQVKVLDPRFYRYMALGGSLGAAARLPFAQEKPRTAEVFAMILTGALIAHATA